MSLVLAILGSVVIVAVTVITTVSPRSNVIIVVAFTNYMFNTVSIILFTAVGKL